MVKHKKRHKKKTLVGPAGRGFEFGFRPIVMLVSESAIEFNRQLVRSKVLGFAYGVDRIPGYPAPLACISFIAEEGDALAEAFKCFEQWGSQDDGDAVDITILLKKDGEYLFGVTPNVERLIDRMVTDTTLVAPVYAGAIWVKTVDTTNPILRDWKTLLASKLFPIQILAASTTVRNKVPRPDSIKIVPNTNPFIKFGLKIITEDEEPEHPFLNIVNNKKPNFKKPERRSAEEIAANRQKVIDTAFPVSRERVRREGLLEKCRAALGKIEVSNSQIEQAAINVMLSREWLGDENHYQTISSLQDDWWNRIRGRIEFAATTNSIHGMNAKLVIEQIKLDVAHVLREHGTQVSPKFRTNQHLFARLGYAGIA